MQLQEIADKYSIYFPQLYEAAYFLEISENLKKDGEYRLKYTNDAVHKIIDARPWMIGIKDRRTNFDELFQVRVNSIGWAPERHPIQKITFHLSNGEIVKIEDPATIEAIRQGLELFEKHILKVDPPERHRPKSKRKEFAKKAYEIILSYAPDGSEYSKYLFVGKVVSDMGFLKTTDELDNDPGGYITYEEYLSANIKNILKR